MILTRLEAFGGLGPWTANQGRVTIWPVSLFTRALGVVADVASVLALVAAFCLFDRRASRSASCPCVGVNVPGSEDISYSKQGSGVVDDTKL